MYNPGCLEYYKTSTYTQAARCYKCSKTLATHDSLYRDNYTRALRCSNCYSLYKASYSLYLAALSRVNERLIRPTKRTLTTI